MKKLVLILAAAGTLAAVPANAADFRPGDHNRGSVQQNWNRSGHDNRQQVRGINGTQGHRWARGQRFDRRYASNYQVIDNYQAYRLQAPPRGYRYVRSNNDIVMVAIASGIIDAVFGNQF